MPVLHQTLSFKTVWSTVVWKPWTFNDMPNIIFPKEKILANGGKPTEERHVNQ